MEDKLLYCVVEQDVADEDNAAITFLMTKKNFNKLKNKSCEVSWGQFDVYDFEDTFNDIVTVNEITKDQAKFLYELGVLDICAGSIVFEDDICLDDYIIGNFAERLIKESSDVEVYNSDICVCAEEKIFVSKSLGLVFGYEYDETSRLIEITDKYLIIEDLYGDTEKFSINRKTKTPKLELIEEE